MINKQIKVQNVTKTKQLCDKYQNNQDKFQTEIVLFVTNSKVIINSVTNSKHNCDEFQTRINSVTKTKQSVTNSQLRDL